MTSVRTRYLHHPILFGIVLLMWVCCCCLKDVWPYSCCTGDVFGAVVAMWVLIWPYCCHIIADPTLMMNLAWCVVICVKCGRVVVVR